MSDMISHEDYYEHHESRASLLGADDEVRSVKCACCGEKFPANETLPFENDVYCLECAEAAKIYRCNFCGNIYAEKDFCPECGTERQKEE